MLLYRSGGAVGGEVTVQWLDREGKTQPLLAKPGRYEHPHLSPASQRLALEIPAGSTRDIWIYEWQRDTMTRLSFDAGGGWPMNPVWSPDGRYIVFSGKTGMLWTRSDGAGKPKPLTQSKNLPIQIPYSFMPDGKRLSWMDPGGGPALWTTVVESDGSGLRSGKSELFLQDSFAELTPMFSPDGHWLAYTSNESGIFEVYVRTFPTGGKWKISNGGGSFPVWSHNGRELFFRSADNRIMVAAYTVKGDSFEVADQPRAWSEKRLSNTGANFSTANFDFAPDGKRVAAIMPVETPEVQRAQSHVVLLINFFDELRRRAPVGGK